MSDILGVLASVLGKTDDGELSNALKTGDGEVDVQKLEEWLKQSLDDKIKASAKEAFDSGHKRGLRESLTKVEGVLVDKLQVPAELKGDLDAVVDYITTNKTTPEPRQTEGVSPEVIRSSEVYQEDMRKFQEKLKQQAEAMQQLDQQHKNRFLEYRLQQDVPKILDGKYLVPEDGTVRSNLFKLLKNLITEGGVELREHEGEIVPWNMEADEPIKNDQYQPVGFKDYILSKAGQVFLKADAVPPASSPKPKLPNGEAVGESAPSGGNVSFPPLKTHSEFFQYRNKLKQEDASPEVMQQFREYYAKQEQAGLVVND